MSEIKNNAEIGEEEVLKLDASIESAQERNELVKKIIDKTPPEKLTNRYLEVLTNYIMDAVTKEEKKLKQKTILTDNIMKNVNVRETSFEGLIGKLENGEDGIYNMIANDKNIIFKPDFYITPKDVAEIPALKELDEAIEKVIEMEKTATGRRKFLLHTQLIEMRKDRYVIKNVYHQPMYSRHLTKSLTNSISFDDGVSIDEEGNVKSTELISLFDYKHVSALLCSYSKLKEDSWGKFYADIYYLMADLDKLIEKALKEKHPLYYDLLIYKIDGKQNIEIQSLLEKNHNIRHSLEYISSLWRNKIPKIIANQAQEDYIIWYYTAKEKGKWKKCSRCGQIKLAHNRFFSKNKTSKDGFYSICKECRNKKQ